MTAAPRAEPAAGPAAVALRGLAVRYPHAARDALGPVTLDLVQGERLLLLGPSGCGKSTLLHALTGLVPRSIPAETRGGVDLFGEPVTRRSPAEWAARVAILFQDADQTLAGFTVEDEIAFGLENRNHPPHGMLAAVAAAMARAGLPDNWRTRRIATLSGGQRQLVALAAILVQAPDLVIADEPTASLAPAAAQLLAGQILAPGRSALVVDHRLGPLLDRIDRVAVLDGAGQALTEGTPAQVFGAQGALLVGQGIWTPPAVRLRLALSARGVALPPLWRIPDLLTHLPAGTDLAPLLLPPPAPPGPELLRLTGAACAPPFGPVVLRDVTLSLCAGQVLGILGPNGAGKSTLAACLAGLVPLRAGRREGPDGAIAFQNPEAHFSAESPRAELAGLGLRAEAADAVLADWGLDDVADQHPYTLSTGQKRRLALVLLTATDRWPVLVLDEPTAGLDHRGTQRVARHVRALARAGRALAVVTHDADFALAVCDRIAVLDGGTLAATGPAPQILGDAPRLAGWGLAPPEVAPLLRADAGAISC